MRALAADRVADGFSAAFVVLVGTAALNASLGAVELGLQQVAGSGMAALEQTVPNNGVRFVAQLVGPSSILTS